MRMGIWIVEYYHVYDGMARWEQYCGAEFSDPRYAINCARNVLRLNTEISVRVSKVEPLLNGGWKILDWTFVDKWTKDPFGESKFDWKEEGF